MNRKEFEEHVKKIKELYPAGAKIRLIKMHDKQAPPKGTVGRIRLVDDIGTVHVNWETGSSLGLIPEVDEFEVIS